MRTAYFVGLMAFALALTVRLVGLNSRDLWLDEVYSQFAISRDWLGLAKDRIGHGHSPLYFALIKATGIDVENVAALRAMSSIFDSLASAILAFAISIYLGWRPAVFFAFLYAFSPIAIQWAQNIRPYGLMMLFLAIGVSGAMGLLAARNQTTVNNASQVRRSTRLFGIGFALTSLTMTAGVFAFAVTAVGPFLFASIRQDKAFVGLWRRALRWPGTISVLAYLLIANAHVVRNVDGYWAEKNNSLSFESLWNIWQALLFGTGRENSALVADLSVSAQTWLYVTLSLAVVGCAIVGARQVRRWPAIVPILSLALGYTIFLILISVWTSLLVPRYFLPSWVAILALSGIGMSAIMMRWRWSLFLIAPVLLIHASFGVSQSIHPGRQWDMSFAHFGALMDAPSVDPTWIFYAPPKSKFRNKLIMETFTARLDRSEMKRPKLLIFKLDRFREKHSAHETIFLVVPDKLWKPQMQSDLPAPSCVVKENDYVLAYWGDAPDASCSDLAAPNGEPSEN